MHSSPEALLSHYFSYSVINEILASLHERNPALLVEYGKSNIFTLHNAIMENNLIVPIKNKP
jgi:hypothetical protein